mmetsp:Transcript_13456/g.31659  ORF Transcript_13456/g.31659 Transcript_13456/m.31659 type:complete len:563 (-) Transcript_13456:45-1733(-)
MMIKTIGAAVFGIGFLCSHAAAAEYQTHHQQFFYDPSSPNKRTHFDTKALTPVKEDGQQKFNWAFASTINAIDDDFRLKTAIVKLKKNLPAVKPFEFDWMKYYYAEGMESDLNVEDIYYETTGENGYVLCGQYSSPSIGSRFGFVLSVTPDGLPIQGKIYEGVAKFTSIVSNWDGTGYVVVGVTPGDTSNTERAVLVHVKKSNLLVRCGLQFQGVCEGCARINSGFNKVIRHKVRKEKLYAAVGSAFWSSDDSECSQTSDALVAVVDEECGIDFARQYGGVDPDPRFNEQALSVAPYDNNRGGLVVTGKVDIIVGCGPPIVDDVLAFKVNEDSTVGWMGHYNVGRNGSNRGTAIVLGKPANSVYIAGETKTDLFGSPSGNVATDAFLLELKKKNGNVRHVDVFGLDLLDDVDIGNGELQPGKLDLEVTDDRHAVVIGNTDHPFNNTKNRINQPYLIERYTNTEETCVDDRYRVSKEGYLFAAGANVRIVDIVPVASGFDVGYGEYVLEQKIPCPKKPSTQTDKGDPFTDDPVAGDPIAGDAILVPSVRPGRPVLDNDDYIVL